MNQSELINPELTLGSSHHFSTLFHLRMSFISQEAVVQFHFVANSAGATAPKVVTRAGSDPWPVPSENLGGNPGFYML